VLKLAGLDEDIEDQHVRFHSMDGMMASIGTEKALNPYGDCIVAYEMNGEPLPRDHGVRTLAACVWPSTLWLDFAQPSTFLSSSSP
jgi:DMSO/TMAO reductase YedYZ molybdopterin-dependent catalytic subunit